MLRKVSTVRGMTLLLVMVTAVALLAGCSSKSVKDDEPSSQTSSITVNASPSSVVVNTTTVVEATVTNGDVPVTGQAVQFSVQPTNAGYFSPTSVQTDAEGVAATIFTASTTGSIILTAATTFDDGARTSTTGVTVVQDNQSAGGNVTIVVTPGLLLANGSDASTVTITARDAVGQPVPNGTVIVLVAGEKFDDIDNNGIWTPGIDTLIYDVDNDGFWDAMGQIPSSVQTAGGAGQAQATYVAGNSAGTAYIKATITDEAIGGSADKAIQLSPNAVVNSIYLQSDTVNLVVRGTGGIETAILEATAYDIWGNPVPEGLPISFIITDGPTPANQNPYDGERLDTVGRGPYNTVTNSQGVARAPIQSGIISGTVRVRAMCDTVLSNAAQIMISAGPPAYIVVGADTCNVPWWNVVGEENSITAVVSDIYMNPVPNNTSVYFTTDEGTMKSHEARTQNLEGVAYTKWISGTQSGIGADGVVMVIAETAGGTVADTSYFFNTWGADSIWADGMPTWLWADGQSEATVYVRALDLNGNYVVNGTAFSADASYLNVEAGVFGDGCNGAFDRVKITSSILSQDYSLTGGQDDGIGAIDYVMYWSFGATATYPVQLRTGFAYTGKCKVTGPTKAAPGEQVRLTVEIADRYGNPLGDHTIVMSAASGLVSGATQETNGNGEASGFIWTAGAAGDVNIVFQDTDPRGGVVLTHKVTVE